MRKLFLFHLNSIFFLTNLIILLFLLSNAENAPLFSLDFSDWYIDKSQRLASDYKQFKIPGLDYSSFNGWNSTHGSIPINHIMVFFNLFFTPYTSAQLFIFFSDILIYFGFFYILKNYFKINTNLSGLFSILFFLLLISVNENYIVNQYTLFGFLILINFLLTEKSKIFYLGLIFLPLYCSFSYPPYNVPIAPIFHFLFILIFFFNEKILFKKLFFWYLIIWTSYFLYHSSLIITLIENYELSNRFLVEKSIHKENFIFNLKNPLYILFLIVVFAISKNKIKNIVISIFIILIPELIGLLPIESNFLISRISYSSPLLIIFLTIFNLQNHYIKNDFHLERIKSYKNFLLLLAYLSLFLIIFLNSSFKSKNLFFIFIVLSLYPVLFYKLKNVLKFFFLVITIFLFKFATIFGEGYKSGFLYVDNFSYPKPRNEYRIATLNDHCFETIFNSSQVLIKGHKTLGGNSVFYPIIFAKKILDVKKEKESCKAREKFKYWNNRVFFTHDEFIKNKNLLNFFIQNNVRIIRSRHKIKNDKLIFLGEFNFYNTSFVRYKLNEISSLRSALNKNVNNFEKKIINVYIYEIKNWKKINPLDENRIDKYLNHKILNFYSFIFFIFIVIFIKIFRNHYLKRL